MFFTDHDEFMKRVQEIEEQSDKSILRFDSQEDADRVVEKIQQKLKEITGW
ncbi:hypothetical protein [Thermoactinomyces vulgaris]|jgi:SPX domain protein involved in polyphosphate accumulation|uniref:hypothetical protein n=1 Tax=Thermoactinomyces vulgaris TaxID=2026 RepID=UPI003628D85D